MESQPQALPLLFQWIEFAATLVVSILIIIGTVVALHRRSGRPLFIVGVPPFSAEEIPPQKIGHTSISDQFRHRKDCFGVHLGEKRKLTEHDERKLFDDPFRRRVLHLSPNNNSCMLPVVVENRGRRAARDYILAILFHEPAVHVVDVVKESLELGAFYCNRIDLVENDEVKALCAHKEIIHAYDSYMGKYGDLVFLTGVLESGVYEMVLLKIVVEPSVNRFVIGYNLDCSDGWRSKEVLFQGFEIARKY